MPADPVVIARRLAADVLAPHAAEVDRDGIPPGHLAAIRASGLLGLAAPAEVGGLAASGPAARAVAETLAGADASTHFVLAQHHTPVALLAGADGPARDALLRPLADGTLMSGIVFSHLRSHPRVQVAATPGPGGDWRFDGSAPWCTGWGLADLLLLAGVTEQAEIVWAFTEARDMPGLSASAPLRLAAMGATRTVGLTFDRLVVPAANVAARMSHAEWARGDDQRTLDVNPAVFGIAGAAVDLLAAAEVPEAGPLALALRARLDQVRATCGRLTDEVPPGERAQERLAGRFAAADLMLRATTAAVTAGAGRAMAASAPAGRLSREAAFYLIQAQTARLRSAHLGYQLDAL